MSRKQRARELEERIHKLREKVADKRRRKEKSDNEDRDDALADQIDALQAELKRIVPRYKHVLKAIKRHAKKANRKKHYASKHFMYSEFDCHNGQKIPEQSKPAVREWCQRVGEPARERFGTVGITSGFRPSAYNASIGGEPNSVHIWDYPGRDYKAVAVDWHAASGGPLDWFNFAAGKADGRGYYPNSGFTHSDTRNNIGWPDATWQG